MKRREVLELLVYAWGVQDLSRLRRLTREYLVYQARWVSWLERGHERTGKACEVG